VTGALVKNLGISVPKTELQGGHLGRQGKETRRRSLPYNFCRTIGGQSIACTDLLRFS
jgi:hypothetical protein